MKRFFYAALLVCVMLSLLSTSVFAQDPTPTPGYTLTRPDTMDPLDFKNQFGPIIPDVKIIDVIDTQTKSGVETESEVVLQFGNSVIKLRVDNAYMYYNQRDDIPHDIPGLVTIYTYSSEYWWGKYTVCAMPQQGKGLPLPIDNLIASPDALARDYQYQKFTGNMIPLCDGQLLIVDDQKTGYVVEHGYSERSINGPFIHPDSIQKISSYLRVTLHWAGSVGFYTNQQDLQLDLRAIELANQMSKIVKSDKTYYDTSEACFDIMNPYRSLLNPIPTNQEIEQVCRTKLRFREAWGIGYFHGYYDNETYISVAAFPPTKPIGPIGNKLPSIIKTSNMCFKPYSDELAPCPKGYIHVSFHRSPTATSGDEWSSIDVPDTWYLVQMPSSDSLVKVFGEPPTDPKAAITDDPTPTAGTVTYTLK